MNQDDWVLLLKTENLFSVHIHLLHNGSSKRFLCLHSVQQQCPCVGSFERLHIAKHQSPIVLHSHTIFIKVIAVSVSIHRQSVMGYNIYIYEVHYSYLCNVISLFSSGRDLYCKCVFREHFCCVWLFFSCKNLFFHFPLRPSEHCGTKHYTTLLLQLTRGISRVCGVLAPVGLWLCIPQLAVCRLWQQSAGGKTSPVLSRRDSEEGDIETVSPK